MTYVVKRLSHVASTRTSNVDKKSYDDGATVRLCNYTDVYKNDRITPDMGFMVATATREQLSKFGLKVGDTVFTKDSETADDIGIPAYVAESAPDLVCGYHLAIARPLAAEADPKFLYWCLASPEAAQQWSVLASGVTRVGLRQSDIGKLEIPIPPLQIQRNVAAFLDRETAQIDKLIGKQERLIELLAEKRQAIITHAVTKGLDPTAPTMPSGAPWLGEVPEHWEVVGSRRIFRERGERARMDDEQLTSSQVHGILSQASFVAMTGNRVTSVIKGEEILKHVEPGDFVISMRSFQGGLELSRVRGKISSAYVMLVPNQSISVEYFRWLFKCDRYISGLQSTSNLVRDGQALRFANFAQLRLPVPPVEEQKAIAAWIEEKLAAMDKLHTRVAQSIDLLRERRSALISAAVTGKIDVRKEAS